MTLAEYLKAKDMQPTAFAREIEVQPSTVLRWINGERKPDLDMMALIIAATNGDVGIADFVVIPEWPVARELPSDKDASAAAATATRPEDVDSPTSGRSIEAAA